jgi:type VI secretion system protein ImpA
VIDIEAYLQPIREDTPAGDDLRLQAADLTFQKLEELRTDVDPALDAEGKGRSANWSAVVTGCESALKEQTKDLQLATWLAEGLAHTQGFEGLRAGLCLVKELLHRFWDQLYPGFEDGEIISPIRARPLMWLGGSREFLAAVKAIPIAAPDGPSPLGWADFERAEQVDAAKLQSDATRYEEMRAAGAVGGDEWKAAIGATAPETLAELRDGARACVTELSELRELCEQRFEGDEAPNLMPLETLLDQIEEFLSGTLPSEAPEGDAAGAETDTAGATPSAVGAAATGPVGPIRSRADALQRLREVADYFRGAEPHSPVSYLITRAVKWGQMSFEELLEDVVRSPDVVTQVREVLGIRQGEDS